MQNQHPSHTNQTPKIPLLKQRRVWIGGIAILGVMLGLLLLAQFSSRSGWITYPGSVSALAVDKQGRVWAVCQFYCADNSIVLYPDNSAPVEMPLPSELNEPRGMSSLAIDGQDRIWVGSWNGAIGMRDMNNQWRIFTPENFTPENSEPIWDIVVDGQGRAWVRSNIGLGVIDPSENMTTYTFTNSGLPDNDASAIAMDEKGQLWVENEGGAIKVLEPDGNWTTIYHSDSCRSECPFGSAFTIDHQGQVWRGTHDGVSVLRLDGTWQSYTLGNPEVANEIDSIVVDNHDRVWVGARQGLFRFDPDVGWTTYNTGNSSLPEDWVNTLAIDGQERVWVGTDAGLSMLDVKAALEPKSVQIIPAVLSVIIPSAVLGILLITGLTIAFTRPGALNALTIRDFFISFFGWFAIHILFWGVFNSIAQQLGPAAIILSFCVLAPLPLNIIVLLVILYRKRHWIALGAFSAFIVNSIGLILFAPSVTDPYYHFPLFEMFSMFPFFLNFLGL